METLQTLLSYIIHVDVHLLNFVNTYGVWTYALLFLIIFCETGLVVAPFLPGDSLLFTAGSIAAQPHSEINIQLLFIILTLASIFGNKLNYLIGRFIGPKVFKKDKSLFFNKKYLDEAHGFYKRHGGKTIIFARFIPIIRTFAPFVAGASNMSVREFTFYNLFSALVWISSLLAAGYFFGSLPIVRDNFSIVIYCIIAVSFLPVVLALVRERFFPRNA